MARRALQARSTASRMVRDGFACTALRLTDSSSSCSALLCRPRLPDRGAGHGVGAARPAQSCARFCPHLDPDRARVSVAHYFSLLVFQEQAQFTYLLSDPSDGEDRSLRHRLGGIDYKVLSAMVLYVQVGALVVGHVVGLRSPTIAPGYWGIIARLRCSTGCWRSWFASPASASTYSRSPTHDRCPLAHVGHYLWVFYLLPVVFVVLAIIKTTLSERRRKRDDPPGG